MTLRAFAIALSLTVLASAASAAPKTSGAVSVKGGEASVEKRGKKPLGHQLARHLDMAVAIDAQSKTLEAQFGAVSARYATTRSISPGSPYVGGTQRNAVAGNLRNYNETEVEAGLPLWLPGQRDAMEATVSSGVIEIEEKIALRRLDVAGVLRDAW
jgi:cobalt-zinc-cadmium efflux system outer membrane protein